MVEKFSNDMRYIRGDEYSLPLDKHKKPLISLHDIFPEIQIESQHDELRTIRQFYDPEPDEKLIIPPRLELNNNRQNLEQYTLLHQIILHDHNNHKLKEPLYSLESMINDDVNEYTIIHPHHLITLNPIEEHDNHDLLAELFGNSDYFNSDVVLHPTAFPELSAEYAEKIRALEKSLTAAELAETLGYVRVGPLLTGIAKLGAALVDKSKQPTKQMRDKAEQMVSVYLETVDPASVIGQLLQVSASPVNIYDPNEHCRSLNVMLALGGACTAVDESSWGKKEQIIDTFSKEKKKKDPLHNSPADLFAQDSRAGGSIHYQVTKGFQTSYNRMYIAVGPDGKPFLFHDVIESGDLRYTTPDAYLTAGKGSLLMSSFVAAITIANKLGIEKVAFGDNELVGLAQLLGFGEQRMFGEGTNLVQKLGFACANDHFSGPYAWRMGGKYGCDDKTFRTVMTRQFAEEAMDALSQQVRAVMDRIRESPRSVKAFKNDYETYLGMVREVLVETGQSTGDLNSFCEEFKIAPRSFLPQEVPAIS